MLLSAARGMVNNKSAWACTGQNQGYRKSLYNAVGGFSQIAEQLQGDDSLFLLLCRKAKNINVNFANSPGSFVISRPELTWIAFLKQRIRWAGDSKNFWKFNIPFYFFFKCFWNRFYFFQISLANCWKLSRKLILFP